MTAPADTPRHPRWATKPQAAEHVHVHPETIDAWVEAGRIRAYRCGPRLLRYDLNEIDSMLTATALEVAE